MKKIMLLNIITIMVLLFLPCYYVKAETNCKHLNKQFIHYIESFNTPYQYDDYEYDYDEPDYFKKYVTLSQSEVIQDFGNSVLVIYDKSTDTLRYVYGHTELYYCPTCNEQVYEFGLCQFVTWRLGTSDDFCGDNSASVYGCNNEYIHVCECGRYHEWYPFLKVGKYIFTEMPKSILNVGQIGLNKWKKVTNYQPSFMAKGTYMVMAFKESEDELTLLYEKAKISSKLIVPYRKTTTYNLTINKQSPIKSVKVTKGKNILSVKKSGKYKVKIKGKKHGSATVKITRKSGAVVTVKAKVK